MGRVAYVVWIMAACGSNSHGVADASGDGAPPDGSLACASLPSICGPAATASCCTSPLVPGGMFYREYDVASDGMYPSMAYPATVSDFRLDTYEVTVGRFRQFVDAGMGTQQNPPPAGAGARTLNGMAGQGGWDPTWNASLTADTTALVAAVKCNPTWQSWDDTPGANEALPMNCITWFEAFEFCTWDGGFLPTYAEWNYADVGGAEQRAYAWSNPASSLAIDCSNANYYRGAPNPGYCVNRPTGGVNRVGSESPNGDGKWGQADLGGNVEEWTLDWKGPLAVPCTDCADLTPNSIGRDGCGGDFNHPESDLRVACFPDTTDNRYSGLVGVRCARPP